METKKAGAIAIVLLSLVVSMASADLELPYQGSLAWDGAAFRVTNTSTDPAHGKTWAGYFEARGPEGRGVTGRSITTVADVNSYGGLFYASGPKGRGILGQSAGWQEGIGVKGWASNDGDVQNYGGHFSASGLHGIGVYGWAENTGDVKNYGGLFLAEGQRGTGVFAMGGPNGYAAEFEGDVKISGAGNGIVFPDGSRQTSAAGSGSTGSVVGFPRPAYDSGWVKFPDTSYWTTLTHNLGGNVDNYVVDLTFRDPDGIESIGLNALGLGGDHHGSDDWRQSKGAGWAKLTAETISVFYYHKPPGREYRIRIWVYK